MPSPEGGVRLQALGLVLLIAFVVVIALAGPLSSILRRGTGGPRTPGWTDAAGDVTLANADILGGSVTIWADAIEFRVRFADTPYPEDATHHVSWCLDTDSDVETGGACGWGDFVGADEGFTLWGDLNAIENCNFTASGFLSSLDVRQFLWYDGTSHTLRLRVPSSVLEGVESFRYLVESAFGGSFGANDLAPQRAGFGSGGVSFFSEARFLSFSGTQPCAT